ncbi:hypothetical protein BDZ91DRAFT_851979 [Kalaharituber pfeilii]|nr:hypothetical protein BDZ91DRAFT_851979 [Kalaharituber pfeilii]
MLANQRPNSTHKIDNDRQRSTYRSAYYNTSIAATRPIYSPTHPSNPGTTTPKEGIVVHGLALRKDLRHVRRWMEADNKDIGKITGMAEEQDDTEGGREKDKFGSCIPGGHNGSRPGEIRRKIVESLPVRVRQRTEIGKGRPLTSAWIIHP